MLSPTMMRVCWCTQASMSRPKRSLFGKPKPRRFRLKQSDGSKRWDFIAQMESQSTNTPQCEKIFLFHPFSHHQRTNKKIYIHIHTYIWKHQLCSLPASSLWHFWPWLCGLGAVWCHLRNSHFCFTPRRFVGRFFLGWIGVSDYPRS